MTQETNPLIEKPNINEHLDRFEAVFPELDAGYILRSARTMLLVHTFMMLTESYFQKAGTSKGRFVVLVRLLISKYPQGESISAIRPFYPISNAALSGVLDTLEKDRMIERLPNASDRRKINIRITDTGRKFIMGFLPKHMNNVKMMSAAVTEAEMASLSDTLEKLIHGVERFLSKDAQNSEFGPKQTKDSQ